MKQFVEGQRAVRKARTGYWQTNELQMKFAKVKQAFRD